jgi:hypothetical protein
LSVPTGGLHLIAPLFLFRVKYIVLMVANAFMMEIELENAETNERWRCEYTAEGTFQVLLFFSSCGITYRSFVHTAGIEKMTLKAGYIKRLSEFVDMLAQAFTKSDNNLSVNVITTSDLVMKSAQLPNAQNHLGLQNVDQSSALYRKRYIILIYQGPFDKKDVFFPFLDVIYIAQTQESDEFTSQKILSFLPIHVVCQQVLGDSHLPLITVRQELFLVVQQLLVRLRGKLVVRTLHNGVHGTGLLTEPAVDALGHVNIVPGRTATAVVAHRRLNSDCLKSHDGM